MLATLTLALSLQSASVDLEAARAALASGDVEAIAGAAAALEDGLAGLREYERTLRLLLAQARLALDDPHGALLALDPLPADDAEVARERGFAFLDVGYELEAGGDYEDAGWAFGEAQAALGTAIDANPRDEEAILAAGYLAIEAFAQYQDAIDLADGLLAQEPDHGKALLMRGIAGVRLYAEEVGKVSERTLGNLRDMAEVDLLRADRILPDDWYGPQEQLTWLYEVSGRAEEAVKAAVKVYDADPSYGFGTLIALARRYGAQGDGAGAQALLAMVERDPDGLVEEIRLEDDPAQVATELSWNGGWFFRRDELDALREVLGTLTRVQTDDVDLLNNYAFVCRETRHYEEAYAAYSRAVELAPDDPRTLNDAALILTYHLGRDLEHADALYARAIEQAEAGLSSEDVDAERRAYLEEALRDARNNRRLNEQRLATGEEPVDPARRARDAQAPPNADDAQPPADGGKALAERDARQR